MLVTIIAVIVALAIAVPLSVFLTNSRRNDADRKKVQSAGDEARAIIDKAISDAENKKREALLEAKEENLKARNDLENEIRDRRAEVEKTSAEGRGARQEVGRTGTEGTVPVIKGRFTAQEAGRSCEAW